jgi:DNA repair protein RadC
MGVSQVHVGGRSTSAVDPVSVFQPAILLGASGVILVHNHPSGQASPSPEDLELTRRMGEASKLLSLGFLDHIILTDDPEVYYSFADQREMR